MPADHNIVFACSFDADISWVSRRQGRRSHANHVTHVSWLPDTKLIACSHSERVVDPRVQVNHGFV